MVALSTKLEWATQGVLLRIEDLLAEDRHYNIIDSVTSDVKQYLQLTSLPFLPARHPGVDLDDIWQFPNPDHHPTLVNRPTMPTGNLHPTYFVVGDAPGIGDGELTDHFDRIFVYGRSSHLLRKALLKANLYYKCWFTNLLKLATPDNRPSTVREVEDQLYILHNELELLKPKKIILLCNHVQEMWNYVLGNLDYKTMKVYHPSYAYRCQWGAENYAEHIQALVRRIS